MSELRLEELILPADCPLRQYLITFVGHETEKFLQFYDIDDKKSIIKREYNRGEFLVLTLRALNLLVHSGLQFGNRQAHYFSGNSIEDLALRTASVRMLNSYQFSKLSLF